MISEQQKSIDTGLYAKSEPESILAGIDLSHGVAVVTGGYSGIGTETVRGLVNCGARVIVPARRPELARQNLAGLLPPGDVVPLDLADLHSVNSCVQMVLEKAHSIDILINNAGIMACPETRVAADWELQFTANHIGHFALTQGLMPALLESGNARVVSLSSTAHKISAIRWQDSQFAQDYDKWQAYGQSKTANSLFAVALDSRYKDRGVRAFAVHPGGIMTPLQRHLGREEMVALGWLDSHGNPSEMAAAMFKTPSQGAGTSLWAATSAQLNNMGGVYCEDCNIADLQEEGPAARYRGVAPWAIDTVEADKLWALSEDLLAQAM